VQIARPNELGALYMMRSKDHSQQEAMLLVQQAKTAVWTTSPVLAKEPGQSLDQRGSDPNGRLAQPTTDSASSARGPQHATPKPSHPLRRLARRRDRRDAHPRHRLDDRPRPRRRRNALAAGHEVIVHARNEQRGERTRPVA
jgi:hypothetical protein